MGSTSQRDLMLRFAGISFLAVLLVAGLFLFVRHQLATSAQHQFAADSGARFVALPLAAVVDKAFADGAISGEERAQIDALVWPLSSGALDGIRIRADDGTVLYEGGVALPPQPLGGVPGDTRWSRFSEGGRDLLATRAVRDGYTVELAEDAGALDEFLGDRQLLMTLLVAGCALLGWVLMQAGFWLGIRSFTQSHGRLAFLYDKGQQLRSSLDLHDVLGDLCEQAASLGGGGVALAALYDEATSEVMLRATFDAATGGALHQRAIDEWFIRRCIAMNEPVDGTNASGGYRHILGPEREIGRDARVLCAPMALGDRAIGAIAVVHEDGRGFTPSERQLVTQLASQAVAAVEQSVLFAKVRADADQIEASYDSTLRALMVALDAKDEVTEGHCERVARLTVRLAHRMGVPQRDIVHIERGAMLHDVGKIGVPDGILKKPSSLSDTEWEAMRKHPLLAGLMVSKIGFLEPALPILLYHHERYDGTGYPFGLRAENIPLEARIFSVIDAYDAMTSERPYRAAMTHFAAMEEIRANADTQFDPDVVAAFQQLMAAEPELREHAGRRVLGMHDIDDDAAEHVA